MWFKQVLMGLCILAAGSGTVWALEIDAAGASFPAKVYERWSDEYQKASGHKLVYRPTGSGDGVKQIIARKVAFGATDAPLPPAELNKQGLIQLPTMVGGVVPVVNLPRDQRLRLTGPVLADVMAGKISVWNDPRIAEINPGVSLPALRIQRAVRSDKSGTTDGFTRYLAAVSPSFKAEIGASLLPDWGGKVLAEQGNDGVVKRVKATAGAIGYVSFDRVAKDKLKSVELRNANNNWVSASEAGFRAAIANSDMYRRGDDQASLIDRPGSNTWPITLTTFVLLDAEPSQANQTELAMRFLYWAFVRGDELIKGTGFAPLPTAVQSKLTVRLASIKPQDGKIPRYVDF